MLDWFLHFSHRSIQPLCNLDAKCDLFVASRCVLTLAPLHYRTEIQYINEHRRMTNARLTIYSIPMTGVCSVGRSCLYSMQLGLFLFHINCGALFLCSTITVLPFILFDCELCLSVLFKPLRNHWLFVSTGRTEKLFLELTDMFDYSLLNFPLSFFAIVWKPNDTPTKLPIKMGSCSIIEVIDEKPNVFKWEKFIR